MKMTRVQETVEKNPFSMIWVSLYTRAGSFSIKTIGSALESGFFKEVSEDSR